MEEFKVKLSELRVVDLKGELEKRQLEAKGVKAVLVERLAKALEEEGMSPDKFTLDKSLENDVSQSDPEITATSDSKELAVEEEKNSHKQETDQTEVKDQESVEEETAEEPTESVEAEEVEDKEMENIHPVLEDVLDNIVKDAEQLESEMNGDEEEDACSDALQPPEAEEEPEEEEQEEEMQPHDEVPVEPTTTEAATKAEDEVIVAAEKEKPVPAIAKEAVNESVVAIEVPDDHVEETLTINLDDEEMLGLEEEAATKDTDGDKKAESTDEQKTGGDGALKKEDNSDKSKSTPATDASAAKKKEDDTRKSANLASRNLWVSGLSPSTKASDLKLHMAKFGRVIGVKIVTNAQTPGARCYGYVTMGTSEDATSCITNLHKTELHGRIISVEKAKSDSAPPRRVSPPRKEGDKKTDERKEPTKDDLKKPDAKPGTAKDKAAENGTARKPAERNSTDKSRPVRSPRRDVLGVNKAGSAIVKGPRNPTRRPRPPLGVRTAAPVLTHKAIRDERDRQRERELERERREEERRRRADTEKHLAFERRSRNEALALEREREKLRLEREKLERDKAELLRLERERQRMERERIEQEREEIRRQMQLEEARRAAVVSAPKRSATEDYYYADRKRTVLEPAPERYASSASAASSSRYEPVAKSSSSRAYDDDRYRTATKSSSDRFDDRKASTSARRVEDVSSSRSLHSTSGKKETDRRVETRAPSPRERYSSKSSSSRPAEPSRRVSDTYSSGKDRTTSAGRREPVPAAATGRERDSRQAPHSSSRHYDTVSKDSRYSDSVPSSDWRGAAQPYPPPKYPAMGSSAGALLEAPSSWTADTRSYGSIPPLGRAPLMATPLPTPGVTPYGHSVVPMSGVTGYPPDARFDAYKHGMGNLRY